MLLEIKLMEILFSRSALFLAQRTYRQRLIVGRYLNSGSLTSSISQESNNEEEFRVLDLKQKRTQGFIRRKPWKAVVMPPRSSQMPVDQDWPSVWPGPRTFHPASVPLPVRQGYTRKGAAPPGKYANAELMKLPNFLHLTPPAIKKQCEALKRFCTLWPEGLETDEKCRQHFPLEVISSNYCHSSPVIRNPLARIVTIKVKLSSLPLDRHARDKMLRLVGERYSQLTDEITIAADRCPVKQQNHDYAMYVLTALFHEAWKTEPWEAEKSEADMEFYDWASSESRKTMTKLTGWPALDAAETELDTQPGVQAYKLAVVELFNTGEDQYATDRYKDAAKKLLSLPQFKPSAVDT